jgi:hypothetical protein
VGVSSGGSVSPSISLAIWFHRAAKLVSFFLRFGSAISRPIGYSGALACGIRSGHPA